MMKVPVKFKKVKKYVREGTKLAKSQPISSYHTWLYAVNMAMGIDRSSEEGKKFCLALMDKVEEVKGRVTGDKDDHELEIRSVALGIFDKADKEQKDGKASKRTAAMFSTAFVLMDVLGSFEDAVDEEISTKRKYALAMTAHILTCIRNGEPITDLQRNVPESSNDAPADSNDMPMSDPINNPGPQQHVSGFQPIDQQPVNPGFQPVNPGFQPLNPGPQLDEFGLPVVDDSGPSAPSQPVQPPRPAAPAAPVVPAWNQAPVVQPAANPARAASKGFAATVLACQNAEATMKEGFSALKFKDVDGTLSTIGKVMLALKMHRSGTLRWTPPPIQGDLRRKESACEIAEDKMREAHCALRFHAVDCAMMILGQVATQVLQAHSSARNV